MDVTFKKICLFVGGLFLLGIGIRFTITATETLGLGAWDAINSRLNVLIPRFSIGSWLILVSIIVIIVAGILYKEVPKFHYLITSIFIGMTVDISSYFIPTIHHYVAFGIGLILIAIGSLVYLESHLLVSPIDYFMKSIMFRFKLSIGQAKIITEIIALSFAFLLSAPISIGTFITIFVLGPLFGILEKPVKFIIQKI